PSQYNQHSGHGYTEEEQFPHISSEVYLPDCDGTSDHAQSGRCECESVDQGASMYPELHVGCEENSHTPAEEVDQEPEYNQLKEDPALPYVGQSFSELLPESTFALLWLSLGGAVPPGLTV